MKFLPNMYVKNIESIPYNKLKKEGIKALIFDLDNTIALLDEVDCPKRVIKLMKSLDADFSIFIITNGTGKRALPYKESLNLHIISNALKPSVKGLKELQNKYHFKKEEMVMIGDQLLTDILSGKRFNIKTILVDSLGEKDLKITKVNRFIEKRIINKYQKKGLFERGKYYE